jgi:hypothetical protein
MASILIRIPIIDEYRVAGAGKMVWAVVFVPA